MSLAPISRTNHFLTALLSIALFSLSACMGEHPLLSPAPHVTRAEVVQISQLYTRMTWQATSGNAFHGIAPDGQIINTPDLCPASHPAPGFWWRPHVLNMSMPYKWGGWDTPTSFKAKLTSSPGTGMRRHAAGDIATDSKVAGSDAAVSNYSVGIDCSGFVSRCWRLKRSYSTRELAALCIPIGTGELRTGDILLKPGVHVTLFLGWADPQRTQMIVSEAGPYPIWAATEHILYLHDLTNKGYKTYRYNNIR